MQATFTDELGAIDLAIAERIGEQKYRVWFKNSTKLDLTDDYLKIGVPNHFIANWIEAHFLNDIYFVLKKVTGKEKKVAFNIEPSLAGSQKKTQLDSQAMQVQRTQNKTTRSRINQPRPMT